MHSHGLLPCCPITLTLTLTLTLTRLPASAVEARASLSVREGVCVRHREALDLVASAAAGRLQG